MVLQKFDTEKYLFHAREGLRIAGRILTEDHPMLYLFLHTSGNRHRLSSKTVCYVLKQKMVGEKLFFIKGRVLVLRGCF